MERQPPANFLPTDRPDTWEGYRDATQRHLPLPARVATSLGRTFVGAPANAMWNLAKQAREAYSKGRMYGAEDAGPMTVNMAEGAVPGVAAGLITRGATRVPVNQLNVFAGVNSKTADKQALKRFMQNEWKGHYPKNNQSSTGWHRTPHGDVVYEIADNEMTIKQNASGPLPDVVDHPELLEAYPHLRDMKVATNRHLGGNVQGTHDRDAGQIEIDADQVGEDAKGIMAHELQHSIQQKEGWVGQGSNQQKAEGQLSQSKELAAVQAEQDRMAQYINRVNGVNTMPRQDFRAIPGGLPLRGGLARRSGQLDAANRDAVLPHLQGRADQLEAQRRAILKERRDADAARPKGDDGPGFERYQADAGEVQARLAQKSVWMTPQDTRYFPVQSRDVMWPATRALSPEGVPGRPAPNTPDPGLGTTRVNTPHEQIPGGTTGMLPGLADASMGTRTKFSRAADWRNARGEDSIYAGAPGMVPIRSRSAIGSYEGPNGLETNPVDVGVNQVNLARRVAPGDVGDATIPTATQAAFDAGENVRGLIDAQDASAWGANITQPGDTTASAVNVYDPRPSAESAEQLARIAAENEMFAANTHTGTTMVPFDDAATVANSQKLRRDLDANDVDASPTRWEGNLIERGPQIDQKVQGQGQATRQMFERIEEARSRNPEFAEFLENNPAIGEKAGANLDRLRAYAGDEYGGTREDFEKMWMALREAGTLDQFRRQHGPDFEGLPSMTGGAVPLQDPRDERRDGAR